MWEVLKKFNEYLAKRDTSSPRFRRYMAGKVNNRKLAYVTLRREAGDVVLGKDGYIHVTDDGRLRVICGMDAVFDGAVDETKIAEFLSLDGAVIEGDDAVSGEHRTVLAHYLYYRK